MAHRRKRAALPRIIHTRSLGSPPPPAIDRITKLPVEILTEITDLLDFKSVVAFGGACIKLRWMYWHRLWDFLKRTGRDRVLVQRAAAEGAILTLEAAKAHGADFQKHFQDYDDCSLDKTPPLHKAVLSGQHHTVTWLITKADVDINEPAIYQSTFTKQFFHEWFFHIGPLLPLHFAICCSDDRMYRLLLQYNASLHLRDQDGSGFDVHAVHVLSMRGRVELLEELLQTHPELAILEDSRRWTPLHYATASGSPNVVTTLMKFVKCTCGSKLPKVDMDEVPSVG
jgi:hypothetical protein